MWNVTDPPVRMYGRGWEDDGNDGNEGDAPLPLTQHLEQMHLYEEIDAPSKYEEVNTHKNHPPCPQLQPSQDKPRPLPAPPIPPRTILYSEPCLPNGQGPVPPPVPPRTRFPVRQFSCNLPGPTHRLTRSTTDTDIHVRMSHKSWSSFLNQFLLVTVWSSRVLNCFVLSLPTRISGPSPWLTLHRAAVRGWHRFVRQLPSKEMKQKLILTYFREFHRLCGNQTILVFVLRLMSGNKHTEGVQNVGVVWGRTKQIHSALLQQVEVNVSVASQWDHNQIQILTTGKIILYCTTYWHVVVLLITEYQRWANHVPPRTESGTRTINYHLFTANNLPFFIFVTATGKTIKYTSTTPICKFSRASLCCWLSNTFVCLVKGHVVWPLTFLQ